MVAMGSRAAECGSNTIIPEVDLIMRKFEMSLEDLYKLSISFYRERKRNGDLLASYENRLLFMAYSKQIRYGPYDANADDWGWFDLVGSDRT
ncbi:unnamed protein product [Thelazia callipaeda]|uniref:Histone acetyltransferase n=1 Tax=Thelazia callipaeda TaxID=103827 RepID=A0A0N5CS11_THECL|nr:unnamed protein product [Thelazia callipaeda]